MRRSGCALTAALLTVTGLPSIAAAQQGAADLGSRVLQNPAVRAAVEFARTDEMKTIEDQIRICEIEAPPFRLPLRNALGKMQAPAAEVARL